GRICGSRMRRHRGAAAAAGRRLGSRWARRGAGPGVARAAYRDLGAGLSAGPRCATRGVEPGVRGGERRGGPRDLTGALVALRVGGVALGGRSVTLLAHRLALGPRGIAIGLRLIAVLRGPLAVAARGLPQLLVEHAIGLGAPAIGVHGRELIDEIAGGGVGIEQRLVLGRPERRVGLLLV